jgi:AraC-like DNA-binding protein
MNENMLDNLDANVQFLHMRSGIIDIDFHLHEGCEIYFLLSGDVRYFVEKNIYPMSIGELIITNPKEIHKPTFLSDATYERISMQFNPRFVAEFNTSSYDLLRCFYHRENGEKNKIPLTKVESSELLMLFRKYEQFIQSPPPAAEQLKLCCFIEILVFINQSFEHYKTDVLKLEVHQKLSTVLDYIERHLTDDLSLNTLERELFINRYYLSKLFKRHVGSTIHEYITYKRIALAKGYLAEGLSVAETWEKSGFKDYTSFLKMFKRTVGVLPKDYLKQVMGSSHW